MANFTVENYPVVNGVGFSSGAFFPSSGVVQDAVSATSIVYLLPNGRKVVVDGTFMVGAQITGAIAAVTLVGPDGTALAEITGLDSDFSAFEAAWFGDTASAADVLALLLTGPDQVTGSAGQDTLVVGLGNDVVDGGGDGSANDFDYVDYSSDPGRTGGVTIDLNHGNAADLTGTVTGANGETDQLISINGAIATAFNDVLIGDDKDNDFAAGFGNDNIQGGDGGTNFDSISYNLDGRSQGIQVTFTASGTGTVTSSEMGQETDTFTGIEAVHGTGHDDLFVGAAGNQRFRGLGGNDTFDGGGGTGDEVDYRRDTPASGQGITVDLSGPKDANGFITVLDPTGGTDLLKNIERIRGTANDDLLIGDGNNNRLQGEQGNDTLSGGSGNDELRGGLGDDELFGGLGDDAIQGGGGFDLASFYNDGRSGAEAAGLVVTLQNDGNGTATFGSGETDTLLGIYGAIGTDNADKYVGNDQDNDFGPGLGNDTIEAGGGFDSLNYNWGATTRALGIMVTFTDAGTGTVTSNEGGTPELDTFTGIEAVHGTGNADMFIGGAGSERFRGFGGNDTFDGGGGTGDEVDYRRDAAAGGDGVIVNLAGPTDANGFITATGANGDTDKLKGIEQVRGSRNDDVLTGDGLANRLRGDDGNDVLAGGLGSDTVQGGNGDDSLNGGAGGDFLQGEAGNDTLDGGGGTNDIAQYVLAAGTAGTLSTTEIDANGIIFVRLDGIDVFKVTQLPNDGGFTVEDLRPGSSLGTDTVQNVDEIQFFVPQSPNFTKIQTGLSIYDNPQSDNFSVQGGLAADTVDASTIGGLTPASIVYADLGAGGDTYLGHGGTDNASGGTGNDTLKGLGGDDSLNGNAGDDSLEGGDGSDNLDGGDGDDTLNGGTGQDFLKGGDGSDLIDGGSGPGDVAQFFLDPGTPGQLSATDPDPVTGEIRIQLTDGNASVDVFSIVRSGDDVFVTDLRPGSPLGTDTVTDVDDLHFVIGAFESFITVPLGVVAFPSGQDAYEVVGTTGDDLIDTAQVSGVTPQATVTTDAGAGNDTVLGHGGKDIVDGGAGNDVLDGRGGADELNGGLGNDTFVIGASGGSVIEAADGGTDSVVAGISHALGAFIENLTAAPGAGAIDLTGNDLANAITGNGAGNILDGGAGADVLVGGAGSDTYLVDTPGDQIQESGSDIDLVIAGFSFTLGALLENLQAAAGAGAISLAGNELANALTGNAFANLLDGAAGADILSGQGGDDTYMVDNAADQVLEGAGQGTDTVLTSVSFALAAGAQVEVLRFANPTAKTGLALSGNEAANRITGNAGANTLKGGGGNDVLAGGLGKDTLFGGKGKDTFVFDTKAGTANVDAVRDFSVKDDTIWLENKVFSKVGKGTPQKPLKLAKDAFWIGSKAHDGSDRIVYDSKTGSLFYDADGTGSTAQVKIATLSKNLKLTIADLFVI